MPKRPLSRSFNFKGVGVCAALTATLALATAASRSQEPAAQDHLASAQTAEVGQMESEVITLRPTGFEPSEITRPRGEFNLTVQNLTGLDEVTLRLDREGGSGRLHEVRTPSGRRDWRKNIDPPPGRYVLTEADHPGWICRVTITER